VAVDTVVAVVVVAPRVGTVVATEAAAVEWGLEDATDCCGLATGREVEA